MLKTCILFFGAFLLGVPMKKGVVLSVEGDTVEVLTKEGTFCFLGRGYKIGQGVILALDSADSRVLECVTV